MASRPRSKKSMTPSMMNRKPRPVRPTPISAAGGGRRFGWAAAAGSVGGRPCSAAVRAAAADARQRRPIQQLGTHCACRPASLHEQGSESGESGGVGWAASGGGGGDRRTLARALRLAGSGLLAVVHLGTLPQALDQSPGSKATLTGGPSVVPRAACWLCGRPGGRPRARRAAPRQSLKSSSRSAAKSKGAGWQPVHELGTSWRRAGRNNNAAQPPVHLQGGAAARCVARPSRPRASSRACPCLSLFPGLQALPLDDLASSTCTCDTCEGRAGQGRGRACMQTSRGSSGDDGWFKGGKRGYSIGTASNPWLQAFTGGGTRSAGSRAAGGARHPPPAPQEA